MQKGLDRRVRAWYAKNMEYETHDTGMRTEYPSGMVRDAVEGKTQFDLLLPLDCKRPLLVRWAELLTRGSIKHDPRNWEKAATREEYTRFKQSAWRHFMQYMLDEDDREDHAAAVIFNLQGMEYVKERLDAKT